MNGLIQKMETGLKFGCQKPSMHLEIGLYILVLTVWPLDFAGDKINVGHLFFAGNDRQFVGVQVAVSRNERAVQGAIQREFWGPGRCPGCWA